MFRWLLVVLILVGCGQKGPLVLEAPANLSNVDKQAAGI